MSVLIKGITLDDFIRYGGEYAGYLDGIGCTVELPDHGDLIDREALDGVLLTNGIVGAITRRKVRYTVGDVRTIIGHAPVIIPAERSEECGI